MAVRGARESTTVLATMEDVLSAALERAFVVQLVMMLLLFLLVIQMTS